MAGGWWRVGWMVWAAVLLGVVSPRATVAQAPGIEVGGQVVPRDKFIVILVFGDSNAQLGGGWVRDEDFKAPNLWALDWTNKDDPGPRWVPAGMDQCALRGKPEQFKGNSGLGFPLVKHLAKAFPDYHFGYVNLAVAGSSFRMEFFDEWVPTVKPLIGKLTFGAAICEYSFQAPDDYVAYVEKSLARLRQELQAPDLPIVLGQYRFGCTDPRYDFRESGAATKGLTGPHRSVRVIAAIDSLPGRLPRVGVVPTEGFNMHDNRHQKYWSGNEPYAQRFVNKLRAMGWCVPGTQPDTQKPTRPANLRLEQAWDEGVTVAWDAASDDLAVEGYDVLVDGRKVQYWPTFPAELGLVTTVGTRFPITGLKPGAAHTVTVVARDYAGNRSEPSSPLSVQAAKAPPLKLPLQVNLGGEAVGPWLADKEFRDGGAYGYILSPAEQGDWAARDYAQQNRDRKAGPTLFALAQQAFPDGDPLRTVFRTFRGGNTAYRFAVPDGRYRLTWFMEGTPDPADKDESPYPQPALAPACKVKVHEVEAVNGAIIQRLPGQGRGRCYAVRVEAAK